MSLRIYLQWLDVVYVLAPDDGLYSMRLQYQYAPVVMWWRLMTILILYTVYDEICL